MAEVFKAKAFGVEGFERLLAVKRILPNIAEDEEFITMFIDEAKIAVQLKHANIAQIFDLGKVDDQLLHRARVRARQGPARHLRPLQAKARRRHARHAHRAGLLHHHEGVRGARLRAQQARRAGQRAEPRAPRRLAAERPHLLRGRGQAHRLRHRQGGGQGVQDAAGHPQGQVRLHVARAGARAAARPPQRHLLARHRASTSCSPASACSSARATSRRWRRCATSRSCRRRPTTGASPTSSSASS